MENALFWDRVMLGNVVESVNKEVVPECVWNMQEHTGADLKGAFLVRLDQQLKMTIIYTILSKK